MCDKGCGSPRLSQDAKNFCEQIGDRMHVTRIQAELGDVLVPELLERQLKNMLNEIVMPRMHG